MKIPPPITAAFFALTTLVLSGCAAFTNGRTQAVTIRSSPEGAETRINGEPVGKTPVTVTLRRSDAHRIEVAKPGFQPEAAVVLPSTEKYEQRYLRWGLDYQLGAVAELVPSEINITLLPALGDINLTDRYAQMAAQVDRADALLAAGQISPKDYKFLINRIVEFYRSAAQ